METKFVVLDKFQICSSCGRKIKQGMDAVAFPEERLFFCNRECFMRDLNSEFDNEDFDYYD